MDVIKTLESIEQSVGVMRSRLLLVKLHCRPEVVSLLDRILTDLSAAGCKLEEAAKLEADLAAFEADEEGAAE